LLAGEEDVFYVGWSQRDFIEERHGPGSNGGYYFSLLHDDTLLKLHGIADFHECLLTEWEGQCECSWVY
jgi:hypothetical protein